MSDTLASTRDFGPSLRQAFAVFERQSTLLEERHRELQEKLDQAQLRLAEKNAELARRVQETERIRERLQRILQSIGDAVLLLDEAGNVSAANAAGEDLLAADGRALLDHPQVRQLRACGRVATNVDVAVGDGAMARNYMISVVPMQTTGQGEDSLVLSAKDVTENRRLQARVAREDRLAALGQVAASVAHEIRNPLSAIEGYARLLQRDLADNPGGRRLAERTVYAARQLNCVIGNLLNYARETRTNLRHQDLRFVVNEVAEQIRPMAEDRGIGLTFDVPAEPLMASVDAIQIRQVLVNLLVNALDACPTRADGGVELRLRAAPGQAVIDVADNGCGFPEGVAERLFEPFFTTKDGGIGLGLALCRRLVENHCGRIRAANRPEGGARFTVELNCEAEAEHD